MDVYSFIKNQMPKKVNSKAVAANERKAAHQASVDAAKSAQKEAAEAAEWSKGAKGKAKKDEEAEKKAAARARKEAAAAALEEEEKSIKSAKPAKAPPARGSAKQAAKKQDRLEGSFNADAKATGAGLEHFVASNLDDAIDLLESANTPVSLSTGAAKDVLDKHPERRAKAAYAAYEEQHLPQMRKDNPSLRLTQVKEMLWKQWQKAPENPFNQAGILEYNATKEEAIDKMEALRKQTEDRLRLK
jgi:hypothetical protein